MVSKFSAQSLYDELLEFLRNMGDSNSLNPKLTHIFTLIQLHNQLTQAELQNLTQYSLSTISQSLQSLIELGIIQRKKKPKEKGYEYSVVFDKFFFIYRPFSDILDELELIEPKIMRILDRLKDSNNNNKKSLQITFLEKRINTILNYIEVQRRVISKTSKYSFFPEITDLSRYQDDFIDFIPSIQEIENELIQLIIHHRLFSYDDPVLDRILGYFITRGAITQENLETVTGYSRAMISRKLNVLQDSHFIQTYPRKFRKSLVYYLPSYSLMQLYKIKQMDQLILKKYKNFQEYLEWFQSIDKNTIAIPSQLDSITPLHNVLVKMQIYMKEFQQDAQSLATNLEDLENFLST